MARGGKRDGCGRHAHVPVELESEIRNEYRRRFEARGWAMAWRGEWAVREREKLEQEIAEKVALHGGKLSEAEALDLTPDGLAARWQKLPEQDKAIFIAKLKASKKPQAPTDDKYRRPKGYRDHLDDDSVKSFRQRVLGELAAEYSQVLDREITPARIRHIVDGD
jgi:hypothetical protein